MIEQQTIIVGCRDGSETSTSNGNSVSGDIDVGGGQSSFNITVNGTISTQIPHSSTSSPLACDKINDVESNDDDENMYRTYSVSSTTKSNDTNCHMTLAKILQQKLHSPGEKASMIGLVLSTLFVIDALIALVEYNGHTNNDTNNQQNSSIHYNAPVYPSEGGLCSLEGTGMGRYDNNNTPLWENLLLYQIEFYQTLMHAALLGGTTLLLYYTGSVIWLYFARNLMFFISPTTLILVSIDMYTVVSHPEAFATSRHKGYVVTRIVLIAAYAIVTTIGYFVYERLCISIQNLVALPTSYNTIETLQRTASESKEGVSVKESSDKSKVPSIMVLSNEEKCTSRIIHFGAILIQISCLFFIVGTTYHWAKLQGVCSSDSSLADSMRSKMISMPMKMEDATGNETKSDDMHSLLFRRRLEGIPEMTNNPYDDDEMGMSTQSTMNGDLHAFRMSYTMFAHYSFLLSIIQATAIYPYNTTYLSLCILSSLWRFFVALGNIIYLSNSWVSSTNNDRQMFSLFFTFLEFVAMILILLVASTLYWKKMTGGRKLYGLSLPQKYLFCSWFQTKSYNPVDNLDSSIRNDDNNNKDGILKVCANHDSSSNLDASTRTYDGNDYTAVAKYSCPTAWSIARSDKYDHWQRLGSRLIFIGTILLDVQLIFESIVLLRQNFIGTHVTFDIYKWSVHISSICFACFAMFIETPFIYSYGRLILAFACPTGSILAIWEILTLAKNGAIDSNDIWSIIVTMLFCTRFVAGICQTIGVIVLSDTEQRQPVDQVDAGTTTTTTASGQHRHRRGNNNVIVVDPIILENAVQRCEQALYMIYLPIFAMYVMFVAIIGNCSEPMISSMIPVGDVDDANVCMVASMDLMLAQNWPGMGLFFHFGIIFVIFCVDGIQRKTPFYKPSLMYATFFSGHVTIFIAVHIFGWDIVHTNSWDSLSNVDVLRRIFLAMWMIASGYLTLCQYRLWQVRILPP